MHEKLSDYVFRFIADLGVRHVFMVAGGGAMHLNDSLGCCDRLQYVCNYHEQASAVAAEAYARVTNNLGVALVTSGPGATNAVTGVSAAWLDSTPCLFLSGQVKCADLKGTSGVRMLGNQEGDIVSCVRPITKYAVTVTDPTSIRAHLEEAVYLARTGRKGPVWLDIPLDVQAAEVDPESLPGFHLPQPGPTGEDERLGSLVADTLDLLSHSERPVLLAGNGVRLAGAESELLGVAERLGIPVLTTRLGVDLIPYDHPLAFGMPGSIASRGANFTLQNSDFLLVVGARLDAAITAYSHERFARGARKVMVDVDPAEIRKMKTPIDIPVTADAGAFLRELGQQAASVPQPSDSAWLTRCQEWKVRYPFELPSELVDSTFISTYEFASAMSTELSGDDVILPGSSGFAAEIFLSAFRAKEGQRIFHNKGTGAMGLGQPAAIGACLAAENRRTVCVDGDGGFQMNLQELETIRRLGLPIKLFVVNNSGYGSIRASQGRYFGRLSGADATSGVTLPDLVKLASAYGLPAYRVSNPSELISTLRSVLAQPGPGVCDVMVRPDEPRGPCVTSVLGPDGSMLSKPLEDLWPFLPRDEFHANMIVPPIDQP